MKTGTVIALTLLVWTADVSSALAGGRDVRPPLSGERKFSASDIPSARLKKPGRVVISNDHRSITAYRFFGNIREALVSLRSTRAIPHAAAFGPAVFDPHASAAAPTHYSDAVHEAARTHGVDPRLVAAVARRESAWKANAVSPVGACGIMQLMPATARYLGVTNVFDARQNIFAGTRYLRTLLDTFDGDLDLALAAYNAGPGAVEKYRGVPPYRETRAYVAAVRSTYEASLH
ncbi:MAG TPA: lytic transglycosylase domain-containing protein [Thermoanaerobaculia bacterium]|nr:lytic transglycosylase domain-containing protein [Thermoanaerobaculia bacterium]